MNKANKITINYKQKNNKRKNNFKIWINSYE